MTPLITPAQGRACLRAAERIAEGERACNHCWNKQIALKAIGWALGGFSEPEYLFDVDNECRDFDPAHAMLALTWCATIAGEA
jgi:hypothetical protein